MWNPHGQRQMLCSNCQHCRVLVLIASIGIEETKGGVVAEAIIYGEVRADAPGILSIEAQPLDILRKLSAAGRPVCNCGQRITGSIYRTGVRVRRRKPRIAGEERCKTLSAAEQIAGIQRRELNQPLRAVGQPSAQHRLMDEINAKLRRVASRCVGNIVTELIFLLIAIDRECCNGRDKLIVAKGFKA